MKQGSGSRWTVSNLVCVLLAAAPLLYAGGSQEEAGAGRGAYVAEQGRIIQSEEVSITSYVSAIDYNYPDPMGDLGINLYSGHRRVSLAGQEEILQIGIQGRRSAFEDLPVLNLCFVFDASGSMCEPDKIQWVKEAFDIFSGRLRPQDILSVVAFDEDAEVLLPATRVQSLSDMDGLRRRVHATLAHGTSRLETGLRAGYAEVLKGFRPQRVNRLLFLSDGLGDPDQAVELVESNRDRGISLSTITVGMNCDLQVMKQLSKAGAGSSRFISSPEKMEEIFSTDLDRMAVPIAYDLDIEVELPRSSSILGTWGYQNRIEANRIHYFLPALHHRDYETILIQMMTPSQAVPGRGTLLRLKLTYRDRAGVLHAMGPYALQVEYADSSIAEGGISDPIVLKAGTILHTAQALEAIGTLYYSAQADAALSSRLKAAAWVNNGVTQEQEVEDVIGAERAETSLAIRADKQRCLDLAESIKKEIVNTHLRLGEECFEEELVIARKYIEILGGELRLGPVVISRMLEDQELPAHEAAAGLSRQLEDLAEELIAVLEQRPPGAVAFFGFHAAGQQRNGQQRNATLRLQAESIVRSRLGRVDGYRLIPQAETARTLSRLEMSGSDLLDNDRAFQAGKALRADYLLAGHILEMPASTVVFGKLLNCGSGDVESLAQAIIVGEDR